MAFTLAAASLLAQPRPLFAQNQPSEEDVHVLAPLEVEVSSTISAVKQKMRGFEQRRHSARGTFITREEIERRSVLRVSDLLKHVLGVHVRSDASGRARISMGRGLYECEPKFFIDGSPRAMHIDDYRAVHIEGIEIYTRVSNAPPGYRSGRCGSVIIWSRETLRPHRQEQ